MNQLNNEHLSLIYDAIFLPMMIDVVRKNQIKATQSKDLLKMLQYKLCEIVLKQLHTDLAAVKAKLRKHSIIVKAEQRDEFNLNYSITVEGVKQTLTLPKKQSKYMLSSRLGKVTNDLENQMKDITFHPKEKSTVKYTY